MPELRPYTAEEIAWLERDYPHTRTADLAKAMGRATRSVWSKAIRMGLRKTPECKSELARLSQRANIKAQKTQFKKGQIPQNKGVKGWQAGGRAHETQFKKGHTRNLTYPLGTERITKDGYREIKVTNQGRGADRWRALHVLNWEAAHGPLPPGHAVAFKDRNKLNCELDNLELITRAELMRRNSIHHYPSELVYVMRLVAKAQRKINNRNQHENQD